MSKLLNKETIETVTPNMLMSKKNLTRGLGGMVMQMAPITNLFTSIESFSTWKGVKPSVTLWLEDQKIVVPQLPIGMVLVNGKKLEF